MADLAIGISKTAVEALVNKVKSALKEEAAKWQTLERDIIFIKDEFEMMQSFLETATGERMKNLVARTWVRQVRDLSYDTEDCIEFVLHLHTKRSFWKRLLRSDMVQTMLPLDQAVAEIKQLKARAEDVNQRNLRYSVVSDHGEQMRQTTAASQRTLDMIKKSTDAFCNQEDTLDLASLIKTEVKGLQVISVWGTGGDFGTSSIIKQAYDDPEICKMFECRAWVKLVQPFNPHEFIRSLLAGFYTSSHRHEKEADENSVHNDENSNTRWSLGKIISSSLALANFAKILFRIYLNLQNMSGQQEADIGVKLLAAMEATQDSILTDFKATIKKKRYLIVLQDLSSIVQWNIIRTLMPDMKNRSRIVVSTQQHEVASLCTEQPNHEGLLRKFSPDHSVYALFKELPKMRQSSERKMCTKDELRAITTREKFEEHWQREHHLFGRESELKKIWEQIQIAYLRRAGTVTSVWGMAGVGKSFLVEAIYNHFANNFESSALVSATHPFDIKHLCQDLVHELKLEKGQEDIFVRCWKHMEERWCLVVIDGLRSTEDWDLIESNLISGASRSCIIVISKEESVARYCAKSDNAVCRIHGLEAEAARLLLEKVQQETGKSDGNGTSRWDSSTKEEARLIIDKCGRLPKLIVALAKYLAEVPDPRREAQRLNGNFMNALRTGSHELEVMSLIASGRYSPRCIRVSWLVLNSSKNASSTSQFLLKAISFDGAV